MKMLVALVALVTGCALGQTTMKMPQTKAPKNRSQESSAMQNSRVGRYQLFFSPLARADVYLVDTETGQVWKPITITNATDTNFKSAPEVSVYQERVDTESEFDIWLTLHKTPTTITPTAQEPPQ